jgi:hypothetical protein
MPEIVKVMMSRNQCKDAVYASHQPITHPLLRLKPVQRAGFSMNTKEIEPSHAR